MKAIKRQESRYTRSLIEASLDPLFTISPDGIITDINNASINITEMTREHLIGTDFIEYFTEPDKAREIYKQVFADGFVADFPLTICDGKLTEVLFNGSVYKDDKGNVLGAVLVARDIAEQKLAVELRVANKELAFQNEEKEKRAAELIIANKELIFQNKEKEKRAAELILANKELIFQNEEKEKRAAELILADKELAYQNVEKEKRAAELIIANKELVYQNEEKEKQVAANIKLEAFSYSLKLASQYSLSLIEASLDPLVTISTEGKITDMNEAMANITGMTREALTGTDFLDYFTNPQMAREVYQEVFAKGSVADSPLTVRHKNGKLTEVLFNGSVYKDDRGNVLGVVIVARDVTAQKIFEKELVEAKVFAELATKIAIESKSKAESATKIAEDAQSKAESATEIAENAVKSKQQFLSNMSHEIRTPMNAIIGFTKVLLKTDLTLKQKEYLSAIKMSGDSLIVLINDILDLAKVDAGKMTFEHTPFKMAASISAMVHLFETKIHEKNLRLVKKYDDNIPKVLIGDSVRLHQIILNLISNAVKFTTEGEIIMSVQLLNENEEKVNVEFAVTDTGIGIAQEKMEHIFENFQQASSETARLYGGTGLGLAIAKQLVETQGGTINVKSKPGKGSTFSFVLPFQKAKAGTELETETIELDMKVKNIRVLVVEDIALNQLLMKTLLDDYEFENDIAGNGNIAIEKLQNRMYDIILMDLQMPEMNGFEATKYIRNIMKSKIPIIALTADVTTADLQKCMAVGMNDYISKPVDERLLYYKIIDLLKKPILIGDADIKEEKDFQSPVTKIRSKCVDLTFLSKRTKANRELMMEMIALYLEQTPPLIIKLKESVYEKDWDSMYTTIHKMIPSFSIMGLHNDFENMAKKVQEYASTKKHLYEIKEMVLQLENVCTQACKELEEEYALIKKIN
jgi:PAS domain S-box-containing protein